MRDSIDLLRETPVDAARLAEVRRRVLARVGARGPGPGRWILAGAATLVLLGALLWPRLPPEPTVVAWNSPEPPDWALAPPAAVRTPSVQADHGLPPVARSREAKSPEIAVVAVSEGTAMLEIPTSNPDVVLYWLVDGGGD